MPCPTCQQPLQSKILDNQQVLHCPNCGSTFFDENSINRISISSAEKLAKEKKLEINAPAHISCPRDNIFLLPINEESIPSHVRLYECPQCKGVFTGPDDLVTFKKAQDAKINYFKLWQIPLPSLGAVVVLGVVGVVFLVTLLSTSSLQRKNLTNTQASEFVNNLAITSSNRYIFISFKTPVPLKAQILFIEQPTGIIETKNLDNTFTTNHQLVTGDLSPNKQYLYKIILTDPEGNTVSTDTLPLQFQEE